MESSGVHWDVKAPGVYRIKPWRQGACNPRLGKHVKTLKPKPMAASSCTCFRGQWACTCSGHARASVVRQQVPFWVSCRWCLPGSACCSGMLMWRAGRYASEHCLLAGPQGWKDGRLSPARDLERWRQQGQLHVLHLSQGTIACPGPGGMRQAEQRWTGRNSGAVWQRDATSFTMRIVARPPSPALHWCPHRWRLRLASPSCAWPSRGTPRQPRWCQPGPRWPLHRESWSAPPSQSRPSSANPLLWSAHMLWWCGCREQDWGFRAWPSHTSPGSQGASLPPVNGQPGSSCSWHCGNVHESEGVCLCYLRLGWPALSADGCSLGLQVEQGMESGGMQDTQLKLGLCRVLWLGVQGRMCSAWVLPADSAGSGMQTGRAAALPRSGSVSSEGRSDDLCARLAGQYETCRFGGLTAAGTGRLGMMLRLGEIYL